MEGILILVGMSVSVCPTSKEHSLSRTWLDTHSCSASISWVVPEVLLVEPYCELYQKADSAEMQSFIWINSSIHGTVEPAQYSGTPPQNLKKKKKKISLTLCISNCLDNNSVSPRRAAAQINLNWDEPLNAFGKPVFSFLHITSHFRPEQDSAMTHIKPIRKLTQV